MREITKHDEIINSRDVIDRIEELKELLTDSPDQFTPDDDRELASLERISEQGGTLDDWEYGVTLIRYSYFSDYVRDLAIETACEYYRPTHSTYEYERVDVSEHWPFNCVDWNRAADEIMPDYTDIYFDGVTYYARV